jgi:hypothetical protein
LDDIRVFAPLSHPGDTGDSTVSHRLLHDAVSDDGILIDILLYFSQLVIASICYDDRVVREELSAFNAFWTKELRSIDL